MAYPVYKFKLSAVLLLKIVSPSRVAGQHCTRKVTGHEHRRYILSYLILPQCKLYSYNPRVKFHILLPMSAGLCTTNGGSTRPLHG